MLVHVTLSLRSDLTDRATDYSWLPGHLSTHRHHLLPWVLLLLLHQLLRRLLPQTRILLHHRRLIPTWRPLIHWNEMSTAGIRHLDGHRPLHLRRRHHAACLSSYANTDTDTATRRHFAIAHVRRLLSCGFLLHLLNHLEDVSGRRLRARLQPYPRLMRRGQIGRASPWFHGNTGCHSDVGSLLSRLYRSYRTRGSRVHHSHSSP